MITNQQGAMALSLLLTGGGLITGLAATDVAAQPFPEGRGGTAFSGR